MGRFQWSRFAQRVDLDHVGTNLGSFGVVLGRAWGGRRRWQERHPRRRWTRRTKWRGRRRRRGRWRWWRWWRWWPCKPRRRRRRTLDEHSRHTRQTLDDPVRPEFDRPEPRATRRADFAQSASGTSKTGSAMASGDYPRARATFGSEAPHCSGSSAALHAA